MSSNAGLKHLDSLDRILGMPTTPKDEIEDRP
jgi:hypothetical protein